jgi:hypothetical protein
LNSGVNERRGRDFFLPTLSMVGHPSGVEPLMMDVRQSGSGPVRDAVASTPAPGPLCMRPLVATPSRGGTEELGPPVHRVMAGRLLLPVAARRMTRAARSVGQILGPVPPCQQGDHASDGDGPGEHRARIPAVAANAGFVVAGTVTQFVPCTGETFEDLRYVRQRPPPGS